MNSYPPELLTQLAPVMFVGGLDPPPASGKTTDPFVVLSHRLREALVNQRKVAIWQPEKKKTFQVILVDKVSMSVGNCLRRRRRRKCPQLIVLESRTSSFLPADSFRQTTPTTLPRIHHCRPSRHRRRSTPTD